MDISSQFNELLTANGFVQLVVLSLLEIVLGIDNLIFISLTASKILDKRQRSKARMLGLFLALIIRGGMLFSISWLASAQEPLFFLGSLGISLGNLVMFAGGAFLLYKTIAEIREKILNDEEHETKHEESISMSSAIVQIIIIDFVFSFDSILAAIKVAQKSPVSHADCPCEVVEQAQHAAANHGSSIKMLALAFLLVIGVSLVLDCFHVEIPKPYLYAALGFAIFLETLNIVEKRIRKKRHRIQQELEREAKGIEINTDKHKDDNQDKKD